MDVGTLAAAAVAFYDARRPVEERHAAEAALVALKASPAACLPACIAALAAGQAATAPMAAPLLTPPATVLLLSMAAGALEGGWMHALDDSARASAYSVTLAYALGSSPAVPTSGAVCRMAGRAVALLVGSDPEATFSAFWGELSAAVAATPAGGLRLLNEALAAWFTATRSSSSSSGSGSGSGSSGGQLTRGGASLGGGEGARGMLVAGVTAALPDLLASLGALFQRRNELVAAAPAEVGAWDHEVTAPLLAALDGLATHFQAPAFVSPDLVSILLALAGGGFGDADGSAPVAAAALGVLTACIRRQPLPPVAASPVVPSLASQSLVFLAAACGVARAGGDDALYAPLDATAAAARLAALGETGDDTLYALQDFLDAVVDVVLPRMEGGAADGEPGAFPLLRFCELLFVFTLAQPSVESFCRSLAPWRALLARLSDDGGASAHTLALYTPVFTTLGDQLLQRLQVRCGGGGAAAAAAAAAGGSGRGAGDDDEEGDSSGLGRGGDYYGGGGGGSGSSAVSRASLTGGFPVAGAHRGHAASVGSAGGFGRAGSFVGSGGGSGGGLHALPVQPRRLRAPLPYLAYAAAMEGGDGPAVALAELPDDEDAEAASLAVRTALAAPPGDDADGDDTELGGIGISGGGSGGGGGMMVGESAAWGSGAGGRRARRYMAQCASLLASMCALPAVAAHVVAGAGEALMATLAGVVELADVLDSGAPGGATDAHAAALADATTLLALLGNVGPIVAATAGGRVSETPIFRVMAQVLGVARERTWHLRGGGFGALLAAALGCLRAHLPLLNDEVKAAAAAADGGAALPALAVVVDDALAGALLVLDTSILAAPVALAAAGVAVVSGLAAGDALRTVARARGVGMAAGEALLYAPPGGGPAGGGGCAPGVARLLGGLRPAHQGGLLAAACRLLLAAPAAALAHLDTDAEQRHATAMQLLLPLCSAVAAGGGGTPATGGVPAVLVDRAASQSLSRAVGLLVAVLHGVAGEGGGAKEAVAALLAPALRDGASGLGTLLGAGLEPERCVLRSATGRLSRLTPCVAAAEVLTLACRAAACLRTALPADDVAALLAGVAPLVGGMAGVAGSMPADGAPPAFWACTVATLRLLRATVATSPRAWAALGDGGGGAPAPAPAAAGWLAASQLLSGPLAALATPGSCAAADDLAMPACALAREVVRSQWRALTGWSGGGALCGGAALAGSVRARVAASDTAAAVIVLALQFLTAWLAHPAAPLHVYRYACLCLAVLERDCSPFGVAAVAEATLPGVVAALLGALVAGGRAPAADESVALLLAVCSAPAAADALVTVWLPGWVASEAASGEAEGATAAALAARVAALATAAAAATAATATSATGTGLPGHSPYLARAASGGGIPSKPAFGTLSRSASSAV